MSQSVAATKSGTVHGDVSASSLPGPGAPGMFSTMPWELLIEIMSSLHPSDLIALSRTSKSFRGFLQAEDSKSLWDSVMRAQGCLPCPLDLSRFAYAELLYGEPVCEFCHREANKPECRLRRRLCEACLLANLVSKSQLESMFPNYKPYMLTFIPKTRPRAPESYDPSHYLKQDFIEISEQIQRHFAEGTFKTFSFERTRIANEIERTGADLQEWVDGQFRKRQTERFQEVVSRLTAAGHPEEHARKLLSEPLIYSPKQLTEEVWLAIKPQLEAKLAVFRFGFVKKARFACLKEAFLEAHNLTNLEDADTDEGADADAEDFEDTTALSIHRKLPFPDIEAIILRDPSDNSVTKETFLNSPEFEKVTAYWVMSMWNYI